MSATVTDFEQNTLSGSGQYLWSDDNWDHGIPTTGSSVVFDLPDNAGNPGGLDDIANLSLATLSLQDGFLGVEGNLTISTLDLTAAPDADLFRSIYADTLGEPAGSSAVLTIDHLTGSGGRIEAVGTGAVTDVLANKDPGETYIGTEGGEVIINASSLNASSLLFLNLGTAGDHGTIALVHPTSIISTGLYQIGEGNALELPGTDVSNIVFGTSNSSLTITTSAGTTTFTSAHYETGTLALTGYVASFDATTGLEEITFIGCFTAGSHILTGRGEVAVEALVEGDELMTVSGALQPVRWIGRSTISTRFADPLRFAPIRIRAGALGAGLPKRDLCVSPDHAMFLDGSLVQAAALVNGMSILRETNLPERFVYYHVECAAHELIIAEGAATESFIDNVGRMNFDNWEEREAIEQAEPIVEMSYPRAMAHRQIPQRTRRWLAERAVACDGEGDQAAA